MSWAGDLKAYEASKQILPEAFATAEPVKRITKGGGTREVRQQRDYNILSNVAPTADIEKTFKETKDATQAKQRERAVAKHLASTQHNYNIITMNALYNLSEADVAKAKGNQEPRGKRIEKDGATFSSTAQYALQPDSWKTPPPSPRERQKREHQLERAEAKEREFNIVNQEYRVNHDEKAERDRVAERQRVNAAAMKTDSYNPLTCKYRHVDEEAHAVEAEKVHPVRVYDVIKKSEGYTFNILNNDVKDPARMTVIDQKAVRGVGPRAERRAQWEHARDAQEKEADYNATRSLRKVNQLQRNAEALSHGYDILSNRPYETDVGVEAAASNSLKPVVPLSSFKPTSTIDSIRLSQQQSQHRHANQTQSENGEKYSPLTTHDRLFNNPVVPRGGANNLNATGGTGTIATPNSPARRDDVSLPSLSGSMNANNRQSLVNKQRTPVSADDRPAGGAANDASKSQMGYGGLKRVKPPAPNPKRASANATQKVTLKPLVTVNLLAKGGENSGMRSYY